MSMKKKEEINRKFVTEKIFKKTFQKFEDRFDKFEGRFESSARATAKSFADNAEITAIILKEIRTIHEDNKYFRASISNLNIDGLSYDRRIENLTIRVEKLELK